MQDFNSIWKIYEKELSTFVLSRVNDREEQKDIMQNIALKIFTSLHTQKKHLRGWLYTLTKNSIYDHYNAKNKPLPELEVYTEPEAHILRSCLSPMLHSLRKKDQEILRLIQLEQYSIKEVAQQQNLTHSAVKSKLLRAKQALAKNFFSCCNYEKNKKHEIIDFHPIENKCSCDNGSNTT